MSNKRKRTKYTPKKYFGNTLPMQRRKPRDNYEQELKLHDKDIGTFPADKFGQLHVINDVTQGPGEGQRIGNVICTKSLNVMMQMLGRTGSGVSFVGRILIVHDLQPNGTIPNVSEVLQFSNTSEVILSPLLAANRFRFKMLWDSGPIPFPTVADSSTGLAVQYFNLYMRTEIATKFSDATGGIGAVVNGAIYVLPITDHDVGSTSPQISIRVRQRFTSERQGFKTDPKVLKIHCKNPYNYGSYNQK